MNGPAATATKLAKLHVAVVRPVYLAKILDGSKTVESRLSVNRVAPFGLVREGETILFKACGGGFGACALAERVHEFEGLDARGVRRLRRLWNHRVGGDDAYWDHKCATARFATFIELADVREADQGPALAPLHGRAWVVLPAPRPTWLRRAALNDGARGSGRAARVAVHA
jgi:hypothetical protein